MKLNTVYKQLWLDALRSGKYTQGFGRLRSDENTFCAVGLLHEVSGGKWAKKEGAGWVAMDTNQVNWGNKNLPMNIGRFLFPGSTYSSLMAKDNLLAKLVELNDGQKLPFSEIADWVEENL